jgi:hypothetical protein
MRLATVRAFACLLIALGGSVVLTAAFSLMRDWKLASDNATFDFVVPEELAATAMAIAISLALIFPGRWLLQHPSGAAGPLISIAVVIIGVSIAFGMRGLEPGTTASLAPRQREAFEYLRNAEAFEMPAIGIGGARSPGYLAMRILRRSIAADDAFKELVRSGTIAGQMYGLCGLYHTDPMAFATAVPRFRSASVTVAFSSGCVTTPDPVSKIACSDTGMRIPRGVNVDDWLRRASANERERDLDICGGALPSAFWQRDWDEAAALEDEHLADFRVRP